MCGCFQESLSIFAQKLVTEVFLSPVNHKLSKVQAQNNASTYIASVHYWVHNRNSSNNPFMQVGVPEYTTWRANNFKGYGIVFSLSKLAKPKTDAWSRMPCDSAVSFDIVMVGLKHYSFLKIQMMAIYECDRPAGWHFWVTFLSNLQFW